MKPSLILVGVLAALAGCAPSNAPVLAFQAGGPGLVSGHTPADANTGGRSEPQPLNSLPPGAAGMGSGPNARQPSYGSVTVTSPLL